MAETIGGRYIHNNTVQDLWFQAHGHCEICNKVLEYHPLTKERIDISQKAHIKAFSIGGPRADADMSKDEVNNINNLMLLCNDCHHLIDTKENDYPVKRLQTMKQQHEDRIKMLVSIDPHKQSHLLFYGATIGNASPRWTFEDTASAMIPDYYPASKDVLRFSICNELFENHEQRFWDYEIESLERQYNNKLRDRLAIPGDSHISHLSVFALAPIPLLIKLGSLLSDIPNVEIYSRQREPRQSWDWSDEPRTFSYITHEPGNFDGMPVLVFSLSGTITEDKITSLFIDPVSIWTMTVDNPNNDFLKSREQLSEFRKLYRSLLNSIKQKHGQNVQIRIFPAVPAAIAIEIGRCRQYHPDLPLIVYNQEKDVGFIERIKIGGQNENQ